MTATDTPTSSPERLDPEDDFWTWLPRAYRDGDKGDEPKFTKWNMEVAFRAGQEGAARRAMENPIPGGATSSPERLDPELLASLPALIAAIGDGMMDTADPDYDAKLAAWDRLESLAPTLARALLAAEAEVEASRREATGLASWLWRTYYRDVAPDWQVIPEAPGAILQIDNMVAGLAERLTAAEAELARLRAENERLRAALARIEGFALGMIGSESRDAPWAGRKMLDYIEEQRRALAAPAREEPDPDEWDDYGDDLPDDDDFDDIDCGLMPDGQCLKAGSEECDWECGRLHRMALARAAERDGEEGATAPTAATAGDAP